MIRKDWRSLTSFTVILIICSAFFVIGMGAAVASPSASINPTVTSDLDQGDVFQVTVDVNSDTNNIGSLDMDMFYDPSALQVNSITESGLLGSSILIAPGSGDDGAGTISYAIANTAGTYSPESGTFVTIQFQVKDTAADGTYNLNLDNVELLDDADDVIPGVVVTDGTATVGAASTSNPTVEANSQISSGSSSNSNDIGTATTNDPETNDESSSASTESASTTLKSVATTQSPDDSTVEEVPVAEAGSSMILFLIGAIFLLGIIIIVGYKLKEN